MWGGDGVNWSDTASVDGRDCADLLDAGKGGLDWLHHAVVRYHDAVGHGLLSPLRVDGLSFPDSASIDALYYAEQDISTVLLHSKSGDLGRALPVAEALLAGQTAAVRALPDAWRDSQAADAAHAQLHAFTSHAAHQLAAVQALRAQLPSVAVAVHGLVKAKAAFVKGFDCSSDGRLWVAGRCMRLPGVRPGDDPVSRIIAGAGHSLGGDHSGVDPAARGYDTIRGEFPNLPERPGDSAVTDVMFDTVADVCREWVQQHFGPAVQAAVGEFVNRCAICGHGIESVYATVKQAFDEIQPDRFPRPGFIASPPDQALMPAVEFAPAVLGGVALAEQVAAPLIAGADRLVWQAEQWVAGEMAPHVAPPAPDDGAPPHPEPGSRPDDPPPTPRHPADPPQSGFTGGNPDESPAGKSPATVPAPARRADAGVAPAGEEADEITAVPLRPTGSTPSRMAEKPSKTPAPASSDTDDDSGLDTGARLWDSGPL